MSSGKTPGQDPSVSLTVDDVIVPGDAAYLRGPAGVLEDFRLRKPPRWMIYIAVTLVVASWIPLAVIFRGTYSTSPLPRIHIFQDMDNMVRYRPQDENLIFADKRAMRPKIAGTVARGQLQADDHYYLGYRMSPSAHATGDAASGPGVEFFNGYPASIQQIMDNPEQAEAFLLRGQEKYNVYCALCHGADGYGAGAIHVRADTLARNGVSGMSWVQPRSLHEPDVRGRADGHLYNTITNGIRNMAGYGGQIGVADRWAIVAYVRTLQFAQMAQPESVPEAQRSQMKN